MTTFQELKPGDCFRLLIDGIPTTDIFLVVSFDIFHLDRVIRVRDERGGGRAIYINGSHAGQFEGYFRAESLVERFYVQGNKTDWHPATG